MFQDTQSITPKPATEPVFPLTENIPLPEEHFREMGLGSRTTFWRWEKAGLRVLKVNRRRFIYAADLRRFVEAQHEEGLKATKGLHPVIPAQAKFSEPESVQDPRHDSPSNVGMESRPHVDHQRATRGSERMRAQQ